MRGRAELFNHCAIDDVVGQESNGEPPPARAVSAVAPRTFVCNCQKDCSKLSVSDVAAMVVFLHAVEQSISAWQQMEMAMVWWRAAVSQSLLT